MCIIVDVFVVDCYYYVQFFIAIFLCGILGNDVGEEFG